jgi:hypothetical protein
LLALTLPFTDSSVVRNHRPPRAPPRGGSHSRPAPQPPRIDELCVLRPAQTIEQVHDDMERDRFFEADEAVDYRVIDRVT